MGRRSHVEVICFGTQLARGRRLLTLELWSGAMCTWRAADNGRALMYLKRLGWLGLAPLRDAVAEGLMACKGAELRFGWPTAPLTYWREHVFARGYY